MHSVIGRYDHIIAGRYKLKVKQTDISLEFWLKINGQTTVQALDAILVEELMANTQIEVGSVKTKMIHLFLTMLPLHSDNRERQLALFANALRLMAEKELMP